MQDSQADVMEGIEMMEPAKLLTEQESKILNLYDRLEELQLEITLLKAQSLLPQDELEDVSQEDIKAAQQELLDAKAVYQVRNNIVESVLVANPILKAVHAPNNATIIEQDLLPLIQERDELSVSLTSLSSKFLSTQKELTKTEGEHIVVSRKNIELSTQLLALAEEAKTQKKEDITDPKMRQQLDELEVAMNISRQRWRIMKATASATIVGSGIDWARDPKLLEIVMDDDGEED